MISAGGSGVVREGLLKEVATELKTEWSLARVWGRGQRMFPAEAMDYAKASRQEKEWYIAGIGGHHSSKGIGGVNAGQRKSLAAIEP